MIVISRGMYGDDSDDTSESGLLRIGRAGFRAMSAIMAPRLEAA